MSPLHIFEFLILSLCVNLFILFMYFVNYSQLISSRFSDFEKEYDYIIVGAGTAGSVIAHRLDSETNFTFIVIEAGGRSNPLFEIPVLGPMLHGSVYDWQYETVPQENACHAMNDKRCKLPQGKIVGGSSKLNNMVHVRGNISHYLSWFHNRYNEEFINKQFEYIENNILHLNELQYESELADAIIEASKELGYNILDKDFNLGFRKSKLSQNKGKRWSTSDNVKKTNILPNALVEKIIVKSNVASGVSILLSNKRHNIFAKKGVILSAGTYNTPKILQLSGIGPSSLLKSLNISVINDLPVGLNLQDHLATGLDLILFDKSLSVSAMNMLNLFHVYDYFFNGKGPLTTPGCEVIGFLSTKQDTVPDLQFMVMPVGLTSDRGSYLRKAMGINDAVWENYFVKTFNIHSGTILPIILHPKSKGVVFITSTNPYKAPSIDPKYLSDPYDIKTLVNGLKLVKQFVETSAMGKIGASINPLPFPGCENNLFYSDSYLECYVKHLTFTSYHPVGTCSMGLSSTDSVVDPSFKVFQIKNLFVADASVLPTLPSGNINAAVAMIASVFFEENIKPLTKYINTQKLNVCHKTDLIYEYLFRISINLKVQL